MTVALAWRARALRQMAQNAWLSGFLAVAGMVVTLPVAAQGDVPTPAAPAAVPVASVPLLRVNGAIGPATADYIARGLEKAARDRAPLLLLQIDTPGGLDSATRQIVKEILASPVPVVAWVAPGGARAASAGAYIVYASHVAAMAPGTNLGAATPVQIGGLPGTQRPSVPFRPAAPQAPDAKASEPRDSPQTLPPDADAMTRKIVNDSAAYLRALAQMRGRNVEWADRAVRAGVSLSAQEALSLNVIDLIAPDLPRLLQHVHGRSVQMSDGLLRTLDSRGVTALAHDPDWRTQLLSLITNPTVAYLLLLFGIYGIYVEMATPGFGVPGIAGAISLLLGMFALQLLPVSYAGLALIVLGFVLLVAEAWLPSFGVLGIGGSIAFIIGSVMLIDTDLPGFGIPVGLIVSVAVVNLLFVVVVLRLAIKARKQPVVSGTEELAGSSGEILEATAEAAWMRVHGERWRVRSSSALHAGQHVRVTGRDGLVLQVEPDPAHPPTTARPGRSPGRSAL